MRFKTSSLVALSSLLGAWFYYNSNTIDTLKLPSLSVLLKLIAVYLLTLLSSGSLNLFNDIKDIDIDRELKPQRILPQGLVSIKKAYTFFFLMVIACLLLSLSLNDIIFVIYIVMLFIGLGYSLFLQNIPLIKNIVVALSLSMSILVGYLSLIVNLQFVVSHTIIIIFILGFCSILSFELQKDINDVEIDRKYHKITFPVVFGKKNSTVLIYVIYWLIVLIFWAFLLFFNPNTNVYLAAIIISIQFYILLSIRNIISSQSFDVLERARIRIYFLFAISLVFLFSI